MKAGGNTTAGTEWPEDLLGPILNLPDYHQLWVAFSGGLDSSLLLQVVAAAHPAVRALHINHQLQPNHEDTERTCREVCERLGVSLNVHRVSVDAEDGGIEAAAREARYEAFHSVIGPGDLLLMAHHADDQAETVLFRMLRGSGVRGLAGMPRTRALRRGHLFRPWLGISRARLLQVASERGIPWVEDPSNVSEVHDRNFLRHSVMPRLSERWPGLLKRIAYSARACAESEALNRRLAEMQWADCGDDEGRVRLVPFSSLTGLERKNLVCWWIRSNGFALPGVSDWDAVLGALVHAAPDRNPELVGDGFCIRRYRHHLYLVPEVEVPSGPEVLTVGRTLRWGYWSLRLVPANDGTTTETSHPEIRVSTRQGGEGVRFTENGPSRSLKTWLQERGVPPWERPVLPLVSEIRDGHDEWVAIGDLWTSGRYSGSAHAAGWRLIVERDCD
ncbi:tRNA lysidine(34) synthetase TilS [Marinobacter daepoensis]|uniref:tRNA lysidine(34) synthetase TilS n=1 Tax=Marinobacter daepoensis TaxID=262077 RepID=UPI001C9580F1|nr:tRNA lysidine(34) synthetase TilS [Marinobacter daepoensis]MBY6034911.1 tRNA lysidine(34) synthetase TilS [Marinobacter daepoensis]